MKKLLLIASLLSVVCSNFAREADPITGLFMLMALQEQVTNLSLEDFPSKEVLDHLTQEFAKEPEFFKKFKPEERPEEARAVIQLVCALATCAENLSQENHQRCTEVVMASKEVFRHDQKSYEALSEFEKELQKFKALEEDQN